MPVYLFHGEDRFARLEAVAALRREHDADGALANNSIAFDGARLTLAELSAAAAAAPFLGAARWVRVDGLGGRFDPARTNNRSGSRSNRRARGLGEWEHLPDLLQQLPDATVLVFVDDKLNRSNPLLRAIQPHADVRIFDRLKSAEALEWLRREVRRRNLSMTQSAANTLIERAGGDRGALTQTVDKLALYAGGANVDQTIVEAMVPAVRSVTIFNLVDAVAERRLADAMRALDGVRADGVEAIQILRMLARTYRQIVITREIIDRGGSDDDIKTAAGARFEWLTKRLRRQAQRYSQASADATLAHILEAETNINDYRRGRGGHPDEITIELLLATLANTPR